ncbi:hypothetical protein PC129_g21843 [Phytophthora cactorum]|uniref:Uncharacterized protein n=1 Tax=Phytophthora cactorum TaxID=29920 RepID=A0A8T1H4P2_9STRA|nr:hypothetical protein PC111_g22037 [Phytophthora cactorum]KAG2911442.1 hypothetical protein PC114_g9365 [Phytophthora cactorum]KAG3062337.1 hypothetical protein PC121_g12609 [Phytophthora cactorum]KAG3088644.1 hypothetical protein PC122_g8280 [Phytophthora cactorum]KAG3206101.1 hypothetical protein PC129_g21843 [Phytophthora cactorum]
MGTTEATKHDGESEPSVQFVPKQTRARQARKCEEAATAAAQAAAVNPMTAQMAAPNNTTNMTTNDEAPVATMAMALPTKLRGALVNDNGSGGECEGATPIQVSDGGDGGESEVVTPVNNAGITDTILSDDVDGGERKGVAPTATSSNRKRDDECDDATTSETVTVSDHTDGATYTVTSNLPMNTSTAAVDVTASVLPEAPDTEKVAQRPRATTQRRPNTRAATRARESREADERRTETLEEALLSPVVWPRTNATTATTPTELRTTSGASTWHRRKPEHHVTWAEPLANVVMGDKWTRDVETAKNTAEPAAISLGTVTATDTEPVWTKSTVARKLWDTQEEDFYEGNLKKKTKTSSTTAEPEKPPGKYLGSDGCYTG